MAKRPNGEGTVVKRPNGKWQAMVTIEGKRVSFTAETKRECEAWRKNMISQVSQGLTIDGTKTVFSDFLDTWFSIKSGKIRLATQEQYRRTIRLYIKPGLGALSMKDLNAANIQAFYADLKSKEIGDRSIEVTHTVLHGCLQHALRIGLVTQNWCDLVEVPRPEKTEMKVWNENQVSQFLSSLSEDLAFYRLAFATGMRRGEILALKWSDIDWAGNTVKVSRQVYEPEGGGFRFQEPKSNKGRRSIRVGPELIADLKYQFDEVVPLVKALAEANWVNHDLVFPSSIGKPRNGYNASKAFVKLTEVAGLPRIRFHDIRHTAASLMLLHNTPPIQVAAILGQSLAVLLETYAHFLPGGEESSAILMDQITRPASIPVNFQVKKPAEVKEKR